MWALAGLYTVYGWVDENRRVTRVEATALVLQSAPGDDTRATGLTSLLYLFWYTTVRVEMRLYTNPGRGARCPQHVTRLTRRRRFACQQRSQALTPIPPATTHFLPTAPYMLSRISASQTLRRSLFASASTLNASVRHPKYVRLNSSTPDQPPSSRKTGLLYKRDATLGTFVPPIVGYKLVKQKTEQPSPVRPSSSAFVIPHRTRPTLRARIPT